MSGETPDTSQERPVQVLRDLTGGALNKKVPTLAGTLITND
jgi:hypothetical protein